MCKLGLRCVLLINFIEVEFFEAVLSLGKDCDSLLIYKNV